MPLIPAMPATAPSIWPIRCWAAAQHTRYLAAHIAGARYIELSGADLLYFTGGTDPVLDAIEEFVTGERPLPSPDRFLGTVLFIDVVGSTQLAARIGDRRFREVIDDFHQLIRRQLDRYQGRLVDTAGDGALTLFDSPARAIACAQAVSEGVRALGLQVRAGVHTGEMEHGPAGEVRGIAVPPAPGSPPSPTRAKSWSPAPSATLSPAPRSRWKVAAATSSKACPAPGKSSPSEASRRRQKMPIRRWRVLEWVSTGRRLAGPLAGPARRRLAGLAAPPHHGCFSWPVGAFRAGHVSRRLARQRRSARWSWRRSRCRNAGSTGLRWRSAGRWARVAGPGARR